MSNAATPEPESDAPQSPAAAPNPVKKPRSPMERALVWGGIVVLLLLVGVQAHGRFGYTWTLSALQPLVDDDYEGGVPLAVADVEKHVVGFPSRSERTVAPDRVERVYRWQGLGRSYGITLSYNPLADSPVINSLETDAPPAEEAPDVVAGDPDEPVRDPMEGMPGGPSAGGSGAGGPAGGGDQFDPMQDDADGDGRLSPEEASDRIRENFDEIDTNGDGFVDEEEVEAMRERQQSGGGRGQEGGEDRPQRPEVETSAPSDEPSESAPDESSNDDSVPDESASDESSGKDPAES